MAQRKGGVSSAYERTCLGIAITVAAIWAIATIVQIIDPRRPVPVTVSATMGIVTTGFFSGAIYWARRNGTRAAASTDSSTVQTRQEQATYNEQEGSDPPGGGKP